MRVKRVLPYDDVRRLRVIDGSGKDPWQRSMGLPAHLSRTNIVNRRLKAPLGWRQENSAAVALHKESRHTRGVVGVLWRDMLVHEALDMIKDSQQAKPRVDHDDNVLRLRAK